jgi:HAD superfamily hydrolase (TIGR01484 family)
MSDIKLVVFDIDGTLIAEREHHIRPSAVEAIHQLHANGYKVIVATGRAPTSSSRTSSKCSTVIIT